MSDNFHKLKLEIWSRYKKIDRWLLRGDIPKTDKFLIEQLAERALLEYLIEFVDKLEKEGA